MPLSRDEFVAGYRQQLLGFLADCYAARRTASSEFGREVDLHFARLSALLNKMYDDAQPPLGQHNGKPAAATDIRF